MTKQLSYLRKAFLTYLLTVASYCLYWLLLSNDTWGLPLLSFCVLFLLTTNYLTFSLNQSYLYSPKKKKKRSRSGVSDSLQLHGLYPTTLLHPWDFPGRSIGVGCHFLLQRIFPTQGSNLGLPHCRQTLYRLSHQGSLIFSKKGINLLINY